MAQVNVSLPDPMIEFIDQQVSSDGFPDRDAVLQAAVADMQERVDALRAAIQLGVDDMETGDFEVVEDLEVWFENLKRRSAA